MEGGGNMITNKGNKNNNIDYVRIGIKSIVSVIIIGIILLTALFQTGVLDWNGTRALGNSLAGGAIGCIGTLIAVMLTSYQTNRIYESNKKSDDIKIAYNNMPIFSVKQMEGTSSIIPINLLDNIVPKEVKIKEPRGQIIINLVLENISNQYAYLNMLKAIIILKVY
jgi:hypothetical protein